jgi:gliding motility-associated-like protein
MKKKLLTVLFFLVVFGFTFAQNGSNAVRLNTGVEITNTIFWKNPESRPASPGVVVNYSALDSMVNGTNNHYLLGSPFVNGSHRINSASPAYNSGTNVGLRAVDTLDLDYKPRVACEQVDIGAYEFQIITTKIINQPSSVLVCEGTPTQLSVTAEGTMITYQWQRYVATHWENLTGQTRSTLNFDGTVADIGTYRAIVFGDCCNDTSVEVRVEVDLKPELTVTDEITILPGGSVELRAISSVGTVTWFESDFYTQVTDLLIQNITEPRQYVAKAVNGVCSTAINKVVHIYVENAPCIIRTQRDVFICHGESYRLVVQTASVANYTWRELGTTKEYSQYDVVYLDTTTRFEVIGEDAKGNQCFDTLTVRVNKVQLVVMDDPVICKHHGAQTINLWSLPNIGTEWFHADGEKINDGNTPLHVYSNVTTTVFVRYRDGYGCEVEREVHIYVAPPLFYIFPSDTVICEGESVLLTSNIESKFALTWTEKFGAEIAYSPSGEKEPVSVTPKQTTTYQAWYDDERCGGDVREVTITVQPKPEFKITNQPEFCENSLVYLSAYPNASYWTLLDGTRMYNPIAMTAENSYVGWFTDGICLVSDTVKITVEPRPNFVVRENITIHEGDVVELWSSHSTATWTELPNTILGQGTQSVSPTDTTIYVAELSHLCGIFRDTVHIFVDKQEVHVILDPSHLTVLTENTCPNQSDGWISISVSEEPTARPITFSWSDGSKDNIKTGLSVGTYTVTISDALGNTVDTTITIALVSPPMTIAWTKTSPNNELCDDGRFSATVTGGTAPYFYVWSDDPDEVINQPDRYNMSDGTYTLTVYDEKGCSHTGSETLTCTHIRKILPTLYISPNNDGENDFLLIKNIDFYPINKVTILNSYGELIREFKNYNNNDPVRRWDGKSDKGRVLPDGIYYYVLEAENHDPMAGWILMQTSKSR